MFFNYLSLFGAVKFRFQAFLCHQEDQAVFFSHEAEISTKSHDFFKSFFFFKKKPVVRLTVEVLRAHNTGCA